jgi:hypothetical protein
MLSRPVASLCSPVAAIRHRGVQTFRHRGRRLPECLINPGGTDASERRSSPERERETDASGRT